VARFDVTSVNAQYLNSPPKTIIYSDPDEASGRLFTAGFVGSGLSGANGATLFQSIDQTVNGALQLNSHDAGQTVFGLPAW